MEVRAITKYVRMSPLKARDLARTIQGRPVESALHLLEHSERKAGKQLRKTLRSAIANAENNAELDVETLYVREAVIDEGPRMKRWRAGARGMFKPISRPMCHVKVVLSDEQPAARKA